MNIVTNVIAWFIKNVGLLVSIIEAALKLAKGIVSITPTKKDDAVIQTIEGFSIADKLEKAAEILGKFGK